MRQFLSEMHRRYLSKYVREIAYFANIFCKIGDRLSSQVFVQASNKVYSGFESRCSHLVSTFANSICDVMSPFKRDENGVLP